MRFRLGTLLILVALACGLCAYARLYFSTVAYTEGDNEVTVRFYNQTWQVRAFKPAAWIESMATGRIVATAESEALWRASTDNRP